MLPSCRDEDWSENSLFLTGFQKLADGLDIGEIVQETDRQTDEFAPLLKLPKPKRSIADWTRG